MGEPGTKTATGLPAMGEVLGGKYRLVRVLGEGAMGIVYEARHQITGKRSALKMLLPHVAKNPEIARRFVQEARASARIEHPNVVDVYDVGEWNGVVFLVMELLSGMSLGQYLEHRGKLPLAEAMALLTPVCRGVAAAHECGVIHRDLKPDNIFLCLTGDTAIAVPKVLDFGVSKIDDPSATNVTQTGHAVGTALYMSLEQMIGSRSVTPAADVYALGVIIYECLTGTFPYEARSIAELAVKLSHTDPVQLCEREPSLPSDFCKALMRALDKDLAVRYPTVNELMKALAPWGLGQIGATVISEELALASISGEHAQSDDHAPAEGVMLSGLTGSGVRNSSLIGSSAPTRVGPIEAAASEQAAAPGVASEEGRAVPDARARPKAIATAVVLLAVGVGLGAYVLRPAARTTAPTTTAVPVVAAPAAPIAAGPTMAHVVASGRAGSRVRIDGEDRGLVGAQGTIDLSVSPGQHLIELVTDGLVVDSAMSTLARGQRTEIVFEAAPPVAAPTAPVQEEQAPSGVTERTSRSRVEPMPTATAMTAQHRTVNVRGSFHTDPY